MGNILKSRNSFQKVHVKDLISNAVHLSRTEAVTRRCSVKKVFLKISRNLQENICVGVPFLKNYWPAGLKIY